jgi:hypothetical protein
MLNISAPSQLKGSKPPDDLKEDHEPKEGEM